MQTSYTTQEKTSSDLSQAMRANPFGTLYKEDGSLNEYPVLEDNRQVNLLLNQIVMYIATMQINSNLSTALHPYHSTKRT